MRKYILPTLLMLATVASVQAEPTPAETAEHRNNYARLLLAAANAPGDLVSDAYLVEMMAIVGLAQADDAAMDPALRDELGVVRDRLQQRVAAGLMDEPALLATIAHCQGRYLQGRDCAAHWARVAESAGDNGYLHLQLMNDAAAQDDAVAFARHAELAAQAGTFESTLPEIFASLHARYLQVPDALWPTDQDLGGPRHQAGVLAMASGTAFGLPAYQQTFRRCEAAQDEVRQWCVAVARRLAGNSSTLIDRMIGTAILRKLGSEQDKAWAEAQRRQDQWLSRVGWTLEDKFDDALWEKYFEIFAKQGEMAAIRYANQALGRALEPPADWQPSAYGAEAN